MFDVALQNLLQPGKVGVIPTDTIYGIVARASDRLAVQRLYELKKRNAKPGTLIASSIEQLQAFGLKRRYLVAVAQFWPGAVSVITPCGPELLYLHQGREGLAVRIPAEGKLQKLLEATGPLLTSSANLTNKPPANSITEARSYFGDKVDFYIDGGNLANQQASTIIRIIDDVIEVVRQGSVKIDSTA